MLFRLRFFLLFLPLCALLACGSSGSSNLSAAPTLIAGDYILTISPGLAGATQVPGAIVASTGVNTVTAVFAYDNVQNGACGQQLINLTGTLNNNSGVLTLTSSAFAGSTATFKVQLPLITNSAGATVGSGTAAITGGSCALASTTLQAQYIPGYDGAWSGTIGTSSTSLAFTESSANASGQFPITITGVLASCNLTASTTLIGQVTGSNIQAGATGINFSASPGSTVNSLNVSLACNNNVYIGTLSH